MYLAEVFVSRSPLLIAVFVLGTLRFADGPRGGGGTETGTGTATGTPRNRRTTTSCPFPPGPWADTPQDKKQKKRTSMYRKEAILRGSEAFYGPQATKDYLQGYYTRYYFCDAHTPKEYRRVADCPSQIGCACWQPLTCKRLHFSRSTISWWT